VFEATLILSIVAGATTSELVEQAKRLFDQLDYDRVLPVARSVLERSDATLEQKLDAYLLEASCLAIVGDPVDAEQPFRLLLRARPDFSLPKSTSPKIMAVFARVLGEERALHEHLVALERQRLVESIELEGGAPAGVTGGQPVPVEITIRDPLGGVETTSLFYRRAGEERYASIPLELCARGRCAEIPSAWTASESGFLLEYFVVSYDRAGEPLATRGTAGEPLAVSVAPGDARTDPSFYETWWFWTIIGGAVVAGGVATTYALTRRPEIPATDLGEVPYH
jgi:hypothetical protein